MAQKSISCRQKEDDAASKKYFGRKKVIIFPKRRPIVKVIENVVMNYEE